MPLDIGIALLYISPMPDQSTPRLTKIQRERLEWLAANPNRRLIRYGHGTKVVYALLEAGYVERSPEEFQEFRITAAGMARVA